MACITIKLPAVDSNLCNPVINFGQIERLYLGNAGNPFTDWEDLTEWTARIDNADIVDATAIRELIVIGDKPAPETTELIISAGRKVQTEKKHTLNFRIDETNDLNYAFIQYLEANPGQSYAVWYASGTNLYGGNTGILATITLNDVIPESKDELDTFQGVISFEGGHPERIPNPMA